DDGAATAAGGAAGDADAVAPVEVPVRVPPGDDAAMLRDWLAAVLVAFEVDGVVGREFPVAIGPDGLTGAVRGTRFDPARHSRGLQVQAVPYRGRRVEAVPRGGRAVQLLHVRRGAGAGRADGRAGRERPRRRRDAGEGGSRVSTAKRRGVGFERVDDVSWRIPRDESRGMRVDGLVFADADLAADLEGDPSLEQVANVATLPGIRGASLAMP